MAACWSDPGRHIVPGIPFLPFPLPEGAALRDDSGAALSYGDLARNAKAWAGRLAQDKSLVFVYAANTATTVTAVLGALGAGHAVALLDAALPVAARADLSARYRPDIVIDRAQVVRREAPAAALHPNLSVLLSTSGSTGGAKLVRLTLENLVANATTIAEALAIRDDDVAAGHLPLHYSYGLSVLTSHLVMGAATVLTGRGFMERAFWPAMKEARVTHFPGVPFHYDMMLRLGFERLGLDTVRTLTQAGGHLALAAREKAHAFMEARGGRFYVMYGQTEAAPRITTLNHADFAAHSATVGPALDGGRLVIRDKDGAELPRGEEGIVWYEGPNVMMGYAETRDDLMRGDDQGGVLATGDVGRLDAGGRLTITGRVKRFGKIYGLRINLDEIEKLAKTLRPDAAVVQKDEKVRVFLAADAGKPAAEAAEKMRAAFAGHYTLPLTAYEFRFIAEIPRTARGKTDYQRLEALT